MCAVHLCVRVTTSVACLPQHAFSIGGGGGGLRFYAYFSPNNHQFLFTLSPHSPQRVSHQSQKRERKTSLTRERRCREQRSRKDRRSQRDPRKKRKKITNTDTNILTRDPESTKGRGQSPSRQNRRKKGLPPRGIGRTRKAGSTTLALPPLVDHPTLNTSLGESLNTRKSQRRSAITQ